MTPVDPGSDAIRKSMMTALSLTALDHVLDSAFATERPSNAMTKKASADRSAVRDGPPYQLIHSALHNPRSAIDF
jgi:hypothetical protein